MFALKVKRKFHPTQKNDMNARERKRAESDTEEDAINTTQKQLNPTYQVMVLTRVISLN